MQKAREREMVNAWPSVTSQNKKTEFDITGNMMLFMIFCIIICANMLNTKHECLRRNTQHEI